MCTQLILKGLLGGQNLKEKKKGQDGQRPYHSRTYIHTYVDPICLSHRKKERHINTSSKRPKWLGIIEREREREREMPNIVFSRDTYLPLLTSLVTCAFLF